MHIAYVMTENDDKQMRSYDSFFPALKNLHISTPNSFSRGSGGYENLYWTNGRQSFFFKSHAHKFWLKDLSEDPDRVKRNVMSSF